MAQDKTIGWVLAPTTDPSNRHQLNTSSSGDVQFSYDSAKFTTWAQYVALEQQLRQRLIGAGFK
jgi:hypothetical protein